MLLLHVVCDLDDLKLVHHVCVVYCCVLHVCIITGLNTLVNRKGFRACFACLWAYVRCAKKNCCKRFDGAEMCTKV
jgi:hypothetical protein